jgi:hypothetical protein
MLCPACGAGLSPLVVDEVTVDVCHAGCGGVWFDNKELRAMDEPSEPAEVVLALYPRTEVDASRRRSCPTCAETVMMQHFSSVRREVLVDECPGCGGIWLDAGELAAIREEFDTAADRRRAATTLANPALDRMAEDMARTQIHYAGLRRILEVLSFRLRG